MPVFSLYSAILMVNIRTRVSELDSTLSKIGRKTSKFPSLICLNSFDMFIQVFLIETFKGYEHLKCIRLSK